MNEPAFVPGLQLSRDFYHQAVLPLLDRALPDTAHSAALMGTGSEVLGLDTDRSRDHDWGPRLQLFLSARDSACHGAYLREHLANRLPSTFRGHPTHFEPTGEAPGIGVAGPTDGPVEHRVHITDPATWFTDHLGFDPARGITVADWMAIPTQRLAEATGGALFHDGLGLLAPVRSALARYPRQVWMHVLACQWLRVSQREAFVGRCAEVGDELGSAVVTAHLARDLMRLSLLMDGRYPPYDKWLGSTFARTRQGQDLAPHLRSALCATDGHTREDHLCRVYEALARRHNRLGLSAPVDASTRLFHTRPFRVLGAERLCAALRESITDPRVRALPVVGAIDQWVDSTDVLTRPDRFRAVAEGLTGPGV
ncbi:DUF4037 domain-containing protein [Nocardiopsis sp. HNM0947]|uniref:DUF4037 domain-containing protein n=1 Tax=Nocardiopsis coralli TaxID=2772213 RepID=A0ABR9P6Y3_9ACTN|nr:DUF4037 domain-containing protein [Nocardiopsis coralli]MBE2999569.1 DUF4037 domain-containing protein [Nocardiopsis coralli]